MKYFLGFIVLASLPFSGFAKGNAVAGGEKYKQLCVACHGATGHGDGPAGAAITPKASNLTASKLTDADMLKIIKEGGAAVGRSPMMISWKASLTNAEIENVIAYVRTLKK